MGTMRLALPWGAKIPLQPGEQEVRLGRPEFTQRSTSPATDLSAMVMDDAALAAGCQSGNVQAFERLYRLHASRMKSIARNLLGNAVEAEDAVQDTFLKIQRSIASFRGQSSFATWTFRILINTCYDARRSRMRKREVAHEEPDDAPTRPEPRAASAHPTLRIALERALSQLTRHQRDVFLLYEVEGFRHSEIASILEISEAASKNTLFQAKKNLRQMLQAPRSSAAEAR
jgi:RNA polymerase sigma-70 factor, ECF subfamily